MAQAPKMLTIGEWLKSQPESQVFSDFLTKTCGYTLKETFEQLANGTDDSYFTRNAEKRDIIGKLP